MKNIPQIGLGTYKMVPEKTYSSVLYALQYGYQHLDCAYLYGNETQVGEALTEYLKTHDRKSLFITTKVWRDHHEPQAFKQQFQESLKMLNCDYVDLLLIHWPISENHIPLQLTYRAAEELVNEGLVRHIGLSNFTIALVNDVLNYCHIKPYCNQIESNIYFQNDDNIKAHINLAINVTAKTPLGKGNHINELLNMEQIQKMLTKYNCGVASLVINFGLQKYPNMFQIIPGSMNPEHILQNLQRFVLDEKDIQFLKQLDKNLLIGRPGYSFGCPIFEEFL